jgi:hypothetical protein
MALQTNLRTVIGFSLFLDTYVFYYNDIYDAFLLVFFKFHLGVEPVSEIFGKIFICCTISFLAKLAVSKNFIVY